MSSSAMSCSNHFTKPAHASCSRRNASSRGRGVARSRLVFSAVAILISLASTVSASPTGLEPQITAPAVLHSSQVIPRRDAQLPRHNEDPTGLVPIAEHEWLRRSESDDDDKEEKTSSAKDKDNEDEKTSSAKNDDDDEKTSSRKATSTESEPASKTTSQTTLTADTSTAYPTPFDDALTNDFTTPGGDDSCSKFIFNLLSDPTFQNCYPVSLLIETSNDFFTARKQLLEVVRVLDRSCKQNVDFCASYLDEAARNLRSEDNCAQEFDAPNLPPTAPILQAYRGLRAYKPLYQATCLQDADKDMYCYAFAATNATDPSDGYLYWLPLGMDYPGSSIPSCNECTSQTMGIFRSAAADRGQLISDTYEAAARQINTICGSGFVDASLPPSDTSLGSQTPPSYLKVIMGICVIFALNLAL